MGDQPTPLRVGDVLVGYCEGIFGRNSFSSKRIEAIGSDWVVVREESGNPNFYSGSPEDLTQYR